MTVAPLVPVVAVVASLVEGLDNLFKFTHFYIFGAKFVIDTDLFLLELDLLLDLPLAQHLRLEVLGHVGDRGVERDAQKIDEMLEGAGTDS